MEKRIPRPLGASLLTKQYTSSAKKREKELILKEIRKIWVIDFIQNGSSFQMGIRSFQDLGNFLNCSESEVNETFLEITKKANILDKDGIRDLENGILSWAFQDRLAVQNQLNHLIQLQGDGFNRFLSPEINKSLGLLQSSSKPILELMKAKNPSITNIHNQIENNPQTINQVLSIEDGLQLIENKGINKLLSKPEEQNKLYLEHNISEVPNVLASTSSEAEVTAELIEIKKNRHDDRRSESLNLVDNDDNIPS